VFDYPDSRFTDPDKPFEPTALFTAPDGCTVKFIHFSYATMNDMYTTRRYPDVFTVDSTAKTNVLNLSHAGVHSVDGNMKGAKWMDCFLQGESMGAYYWILFCTRTLYGKKVLLRIQSAVTDGARVIHVPIDSLQSQALMGGSRCGCKFHRFHQEV
jgi:hypothetical protein